VNEIRRKRQTDAEKEWERHRGERERKGNRELEKSGIN
jgi:hypothetical protein